MNVNVNNECWICKNFLRRVLPLQLKAPYFKRTSHIPCWGAESKWHSSWINRTWRRSTNLVKKCQGDYIDQHDYNESTDFLEIHQNLSFMLYKSKIFYKRWYYALANPPKRTLRAFSPKMSSKSLGAGSKFDYRQYHNYYLLQFYRHFN